MESFEIELNEKDDFNYILDELHRFGDLQPSNRQLTLFEKELLVRIKKENLIKEMTNEEIEQWNYFLDKIKDQIDKPTFDVFFKDVIFYVKDDSLIVYSDSENKMILIRQKYSNMIQEIISDSGININSISYNHISD